MHCAADVIVVGGGVVGLSAAIAMRQRGFSVILLDSGALTVDAASSMSRVYAINQASQALFKELGVWDLMDKTYFSPYSHMHVWDAMNGAHIDFDSRMVGTDRLGFMLAESVIKNALLQRAATLDITLIPASKVCGVEPTADHISVMDGVNCWTAELLIVADGACSATRDLLNVPITTWSYHQQAIVATVRSEKSHQRTAYQVFHPSGPLALLPLADVHESSIVWSTLPARVERLMSLSDDAFGAELTEAFAEKLGKTSVISKRYQFPLQMRHVKRYSGCRWLLMGDAAHTIHPLAGLGLNVGLADLATWLSNLNRDKHSAWSVRNLSRYQRQRKHALWQTIALMEGLHVLFTNPLFPVTALRGFGLNICNRLLPLKRLLIEHAAGTRAAVVLNDS